MLKPLVVNRANSITDGFYTTLKSAAANSGARIRYAFVPYTGTVNVGALLPQNYIADSVTYQSRKREQVTTPAKAPSAGTPAPPRDRTKAEAPPEKGQSQADSASGSDQRRDSQESDGDKAGGRRGKRRRRRRRSG